MIKSLNSLDYTIYFGQESYAILDKYLLKNKSNLSKIFILVDSKVHEHCLPVLISNIFLSKANIIKIESGEHHKNIKTCMQVWETLSDSGADRNSLLINLGGGVVADLGGFVASTFKRGMRYVNIPTTLLAQVDASVGGKTGVDLGKIKNQIGVFSYPEMILIDTNFLKTLPQRQINSGFSEMLKHGLIADKAHWQRLNASYQKMDCMNYKELENLIFDSVSIKKRIAMQDPKEKNIRKILNFGHTIGHAIESHFLNTDKHLFHGEAIAAGMICEAYLSYKTTGLSKEEMVKIKEAFLAVFPQIDLSESDLTSILDYMQHDKKNINGIINFSLLSEIGNCIFNSQVDPELIKESFFYYKE